MGYWAHETAVIDEGAVIGAGTRVWHFAHIRENTRIGADCVIGQGCYVDVDVAIGDRVKIQNGVSVYKGVTLEDDVLVGPNATFTNDLFPRAFNTQWEVLATQVGRGASIGANATVVCGVSVGEYAMIGAGAVVTTDVASYCLVMGNPARFVARVCRCGKRLAVKRQDGESDLLTCAACGASLRVTTNILVNEPSIIERKLGGES